MTQFLGRHDSIESLRKDLVDLQGTILDVFSRTGPVRVASWKFPDKLSCNLDMVALLEQYDYIDGEDGFNQHSHIVLLELVIDRLLLLLQSFNIFVEQLQNSRNPSQEKGFTSLGLVVRNYWSNLIKSKRSNKKQTICDETDTLSFVTPCLNSTSDHSRGYSSAKSSTSSLISCRQNHGLQSPTQSTICPPEVDSQNIGCQTFESCLVPCDACYQVQSVLRKTGGALIDLFQNEGLPSSLQPLSVAVQDTVELGHMTASDIAQWGGEEWRDMRRLGKHLQDVRGTVEPLKSKLLAVEAERDQFKSDMKRLQKELKDKTDNYQTTVVQLEFSLQKTQRSAKEIQQRQQEEQQKSKRETLSLEETNSELIEKVAVQQDTIKALENENGFLRDEVRNLQQEKQSCHQLQNDIQKLKSNISELQVCLDKEEAKYHSACRQQESMQAKQKSLLERVDALDEDCEELQRQLGENEEKQIELHSQIQQRSEEKEQLQAQLNLQQDSCLKLENENETLKVKISDLTKTVDELKQYVKACKERERLLVAFPELSPLPQAQPQSTGNVILDMGQQLQANCIRIGVLEQENITLHSSLVKLGNEAPTNDEPVFKKTWNKTHLQNKTCLNDDVEIQSSLLQSSSAERLGYSNDRKEAGGESGLKSAGSEDRMSTASSSSLQIHLQTLQLSGISTATKTQSNLHSSVLFHSRAFKQRRK